MAILDPEHLFEQAERLILPPAAGAPRQADIRRAISAAYYGVFHGTVTAAADQAVGKSKRSSTQYGLVYRSIDHRRIRDLCTEVSKSTLPDKYKPHEPATGFGDDLKAFALLFLELQDKRHDADYNPLVRVRISDAHLAVGLARAAIAHFRRSSATQRRAFILLLLFQPR